ncbi:unnamed protein product [Leptosia nina]|uniref:Uncharacterized protein n=1 Tax=Leptosia nina TaxID=320188 RepID=A0AAV1IUF7_9NEOP
MRLNTKRSQFYSNTKKSLCGYSVDIRYRCDPLTVRSNNESLDRPGSVRYGVNCCHDLASNRQPHPHAGYNSAPVFMTARFDKLSSRIHDRVSDIYLGYNSSNICNIITNIKQCGYNVLRYYRLDSDS